MALIQCPECGKEISDKAQSCPGCGNPMSISETASKISETTIHCPKCHSTQLELFQKGFSGGKALVGAVTFGSLGLLAGTHGSKDVYLGCKSCGNRFTPEESERRRDGVKIYKKGEVRPLSKEREKLVIDALKAGNIEEAMQLYEKGTNRTSIESARAVKNLADSNKIPYDAKEMSDHVAASYSSCIIFLVIMAVVVFGVILIIMSR